MERQAREMEEKFAAAQKAIERKEQILEQVKTMNGQILKVSFSLRLGLRGLTLLLTFFHLLYVFS